MLAEVLPGLEHFLAHLPLLILVWERFPERLLSAWGGLNLSGLCRESLLLGEDFSGFIHSQERETVSRERFLMQENGGLQVVFRYRLRGESPPWVEEWVEYDEESGRYRGLIQDVTVWKEREDEFFKEWRLKYQLFETSPVPLWEEDFSALKSYVDGLKKKHVKDLEKYLDAHREEMVAAVKKLRIIDVNARVLELTATRSKEEFLENVHRWVNPYLFEKYKAYALAIARGEHSGEWDEEQTDLQGNVIHVHYKWQVIPGYEGDFRRVVGMAIDVTERKKLEELMAYQVAHDALTGLLNRAAFLKELEGLFAEKRHRQKKFALFFIDLNGFKSVNDRFGHQVGDQLLYLFAQRLREAVRQTDVLARWGGDEFVLLQREIGHVGDTTRMGKLFENITREDFVVGNHRLRVSLSVGMVIYPDDARNPEELIRIADSRMYQVKEKLSSVQREEHAGER